MNIRYHQQSITHYCRPVLFYSLKGDIPSVNVFIYAVSVCCKNNLVVWLLLGGSMLLAGGVNVFTLGDYQMCTCLVKNVVFKN